MVASQLGRCRLEAGISAHVLTAKTRRASYPRTPGMGILQEKEEPDCELKFQQYVLK
jgi:hypothetical protein